MILNNYHFKRDNFDIYEQDFFQILEKGVEFASNGILMNKLLNFIKKYIFKGR